jgi:hypothetical protein
MFEKLDAEISTYLEWLKWFNIAIDTHLRVPDSEFGTTGQIYRQKTHE